MALKKGISLFGVFSIATGAMVSSGIFILPGLAFARTGPAVSISYFIAGLLGLMGIFSAIELSTAMPKAGGDYYFINKTFGPLLGTISGVLGWCALSLKSAFAIFGISEIVMTYADISPLISGLLLTLFFVLINVVGVKEAVMFQVGLVVCLLTLMIFFVVTGMGQINPSRFSPFMTVGFNEILITSGFVFISFGGLLKVVNVSEEVHNPTRNIPLGVVASILVVTALYTLITIILTGTLSPDAFRESLTPIADSARVIMGAPGYLIVMGASLIAFITTANAGIMSASRYPMALSRDKLLPGPISRVHPRFNTPIIAILVTGGIIYGSLLLPLEMLVKAASSVILTSYVLTNFSVIILRESKITNYKPTFAAPFYPWLQIFSIVLFTFFIIELGTSAIEISLAFLLISVCIYFFYGRKLQDREYALLYLLKRITDNRLTENILEDELREVVIHRDNIEQDNFDKLIKEATIIEVQGNVSFEDALEHALDDIAKKSGMKPDELRQRYCARQKDSNTAVSDFLAIPHIIIDGEQKMFLTIIRSNEGIRFSENEDKVHAVFLLGGTRDKRGLHLKAIASIANLVNTKNFRTHWLQARTHMELKNMMLFSNRRRYF